MATGSTPIPIYDALTAQVAAGSVDASRARIAQLDEYVGLPSGHPESYRSTVLRQVVEPLGLSQDAFMGPDGSAEDVQAACEAYDRALAEAGGVDLQILGIGTDGHIGFNEPCSSLASRTRIKTLTQQTRVDNARFFDNDIAQVPHHVITQGIGTILEARHLVLLATGEGKAEAVAQTVEGPVAALVAGLRAPAAPARHGRRGRGRGLQAEARGLLPPHLRRQARLAGHLKTSRGHDEGARHLIQVPGPFAYECAQLPVPTTASAAARPQTRAAPCVAMCRAPRGSASLRPISTTTVSGRAARRPSRA